MMKKIVIILLILVISIFPLTSVNAITLREYENQNDVRVHKGDLEQMKIVYDNSLFVADYLGWEMIKCNNGDELKSHELIHQDVYSRVKKRFK